ncbi:MAG TPA: hypothetical protein VG937_29820 [Polyangiaceae bacterium]|nr:hypothetical protein [Polyangiaceae bacterium]
MSSVVGSGGQASCVTRPLTLPLVDLTNPVIGSDGVVRFGSAPGWVGGTFSYPPAISNKLVEGAWMISGTVRDYSGFGLWVDDGVEFDASGFTGIAFDVLGNVGPSAALTFVIGTARTVWSDPTTSTPACARCQTSRERQFEDCAPPRVVVAVPEAGGTITVAFGDLRPGQTAGAPFVTRVEPFDAKQILLLRWEFAHPDPKRDNADDYAVALTVRNIRFIGK